MEHVNTRRRFSFSFSKLKNRPLEFNSRKVRKQLTNWTRWNKSDEVWNNANTLFKWRFLYRRRRCCLSSLLESLSNSDGDGYENISKKSEIVLSASNFITLIRSHSVRQMLAIVIKQISGKEKESRCLVFASSTKREIRYFHVIVVQWRQGKVQTSQQSCCFGNLNLFSAFLPFSLTSPSL